MASLGCQVVGSNLDLAHAADIIVVAVKPNTVASVLQEISNAVGKIGPQFFIITTNCHKLHISFAPFSDLCLSFSLAAADKLVVSVAAGIDLPRLQQSLPTATRVIRVMPNTPCLVSAGAAALAPGAYATGEDVEAVMGIMGAVGTCVEVDDSKMNAVTGLSGSGPAYGYMMIEALADGGVFAGLPRDVAQKLAAQTLLGAARMVLETGKQPGQLKDEVSRWGRSGNCHCYDLNLAILYPSFLRSAVLLARRLRRCARWRLLACDQHSSTRWLLPLNGQTS